MASLDWTYAHTNHKGKTANEGRNLYWWERWVRLQSRSSLPDILPKLKPCLACWVQLVPVVSSALSHQSQQPRPWPNSEQPVLEVCLKCGARLWSTGHWFVLLLVLTLGYWASFFLKFDQCFGLFLFWNFNFLIWFHCTLKDKLLPLIIFLKKWKHTAPRWILSSYS